MSLMNDSFDHYSRLAPELNKNGGPDRCVPRFHMKAVKAGGLSQKEGRPVFQDKEFVEIITPGDTRSIITREVSDDDRRRWPTQYAAFKAGREMARTGTPLEMWPLIDSPALVQTLKQQQIHTVEELAGLDDRGIQNVGMGGRMWREKAQLWLSEAKDKGAAILTALEERDADKARIQALQEEVARLGALIDKQEARRKKAAADE